MDGPKSGEELQRYGSFWAAMWSSYVVLLVSDFADNTFIALAIFALKNGAGTIVLPAVLITIFTQFVSVLIGEAVASIIPSLFIVLISASFFIIFGGIMVYEGIAHEKLLDSASNSAESSDSEQEAEKKNRDYDPAANEGASRPLLEHTEDKAPKPKRGLWTQMLIILFVNEMGDRSQLATVALTATTNFWGVFVGGSLGLLTDTVLAIWLGNCLKRYISEYHATLVGGLLFIVVGVITSVLGSFVCV